MAGVENRVAMGNALNEWINGIGTALRATAVEAGLEVAVVGLEAAKKKIDTTPSSLRPGKNNRNWTFHMNNSLDAKVDQTNQNKVTVSVGWLNVHEGYFLIQEDGGMVHNHVITAMNALGTAQDTMIASLKTLGIAG